MGCCGSKPQAPVSAEQRRKMQRTQSATLAIPAFDPKTYDVKYQGRVTVTAYEGDAVVAEAQQRSKRESSIRPQAVRLFVSAEHIIVSQPEDESEVLYDTLISEVKFVSLNPKDKRGLSIITVDKNQMGFCHFFSVLSGPGASAVRDAIGQAFHAAAEVAKRDKGGLSAEGVDYARRMTKFANSEMEQAAKQAADAVAVAQSNGFAGKQPTVDASAILGTFEMTYLGRAPVKKKTGKEVAIEAVNKISGELSKDSVKKVALIVSGEGFKAVDLITSEPELVASIRSISFHTVIAAGDGDGVVKHVKKKVKGTGALVAFFVNDDRLKRTTVAVFAVPSFSIGNEACVAVNKAFDVQVEIQKLRKVNPFAAISSIREAAPKSLFALQVHRSDLTAIKVIGYGQFGEVYLAKQNIKVNDESGEPKKAVVKRAVKILRNSADATDRAEFLKEAEAMIGLEHPNIVRLMGVAVQQRPWLTVLEFVEYGDLLAVSKTCGEKNFKVYQKEFLEWFVQIAAAMEYIADKGMIHMDLAARNVLLGQKNHCKIADFGLTRKLDPAKGYYRLMKTMKLPVKWMAIESMTEKIFSVKTDVWAFGITMWEVLSYGGIPYGSVKNMDVCKLVSKGLRATKPDGCGDKLYKFLLTLWNADPKSRPDFRTIKDTLQAFFDSEPGTVRDVGTTLKHAKENGVGSPSASNANTPSQSSSSSDVDVDDVAADSSSDEEPIAPAAAAPAAAAPAPAAATAAAPADNGAADSSSSDEEEAPAPNGNGTAGPCAALPPQAGAAKPAQNGSKSSSEDEDGDDDDEEGDEAAATRGNGMGGGEPGAAGEAATAGGNGAGSASGGGDAAGAAETSPPASPVVENAAFLPSAAAAPAAAGGGGGGGDAADGGESSDGESSDSDLDC